MTSIPITMKSLPAAIGALLAAASIYGQSTPVVTPSGYDIATYYSGFTSPVTSMCIDPSQRVLVSTIDGNIRALVDTNHDGIVDAVTTFYDATLTGSLVSVTDIMWMAGKLYVSHLGKVSTLTDTNNDGVADLVADIVTGLPFGFHQNNGLIEDGPSHFLLGMGSGTDLGPETSPLNATLLRFPAAGGSPVIYATGLRNVFGLARHPVTGDLFVGDNEWNAHPSLPLRGDEINRVVQGANYGFPVGFGAPSLGQTFTGPTVALPPRIAPCGMAFNPNSFISGYGDEVYVALFSTTVATIARVPLWYGPISGQPAGVYESFATGFTNPIDVLFLPDGSMLVADFSTSLIHRIKPRGNASVTVTSPPMIGTTVGIRVTAPGRAGYIAYAAASDASGPTVNLAPGLDLYINFTSPIVAMSVTAGNGIFNFPLPGMLDASGSVTASINVPMVPALIGLRIWLASAVLDPITLAPVATTPEQSMLFIPTF